MEQAWAGGLEDVCGSGGGGDEEGTHSEGGVRVVTISNQDIRIASLQKQTQCPHRKASKD
jgi:hypothetical protein